MTLYITRNFFLDFPSTTIKVQLWQDRMLAKGMSGVSCHSQVDIPITYSPDSQVVTSWTTKLLMDHKYIWRSISQVQIYNIMLN